MLISDLYENLRKMLQNNPENFLFLYFSSDLKPAYLDFFQYPYLPTWENEIYTLRRGFLYYCDTKIGNPQYENTE